MESVELIYDADCPNVEEARSHLLRAFNQVGREPRWQEWARSAPESPPYVRAYGLPTILVDGQDVAGAVGNIPADCCRVYPDSNGQLLRVPSVETIAATLVKVGNRSSSGAAAAVARGDRWRSALAAFPVILAASLPKLGCPACWPAYAGLLSALGFSFINYTPYLLPLTLAFLLIALGSLWVQVRRSRRYFLFLLGLFATATVMGGKFLLESELITYGGTGLIAAASIVGHWPRRAATYASCPRCAPVGGEVITGGAHKESSI